MTDDADDAPANGTPAPPAPQHARRPPAAPAAPPPGAIVADPDDPPAAATGHAPPPAAPVASAGRDLPSRGGSAAAVAALGAGLLGAAVVIATVRSRSDGELDWSNYGVGLGATAVLLLVAVLAALAGRTAGRAREEAVTWAGTVGIVATALMIGVGIDRDEDWVAYLIGGTMVVLAAIGYVAVRRAAFVVVAIAGLALVYGVALDGVVADSVGDGHPQVTAAVLVALFVVVVTLVGWALPSRAVSGVVVGVFGLAGLLGILASFAVMRLFAGFFGAVPMMLADDSDALGSPDGPGPALLGERTGFPEADVWWVVALAALLTVLWALAAAVSGHSGFSILAIAMPALGAPLTTVALAAEHPTWWSAATAAGGGILLLGAVLLARLRARRATDRLDGEPPEFLRNVKPLGRS